MFDLNFIAREIAQREAKIEKLIAEIKEFSAWTSLSMATL